MTAPIDDRSFDAAAPEALCPRQPATAPVGIDDLAQIVCCPRCHSQLGRRANPQTPIVCRNAECEYSREGFLEAFGQPVLVDFDNSILSRDAFLRCNGQSYLSRDDNRSGVRTRAWDLLLGTNYVAEACCMKFLAHLKRDSKRPRVLVIGGGARGSGAGP